jgi:hypothetical protein
MLMQQQQTSKNRPQRAGSNAGNHTPTLVPIPLSEDSAWASPLTTSSSM